MSTADLAAADQLQTSLGELFGTSAEEYTFAHASAPVPRAYLTTAIRIVDKSGVVEQLEQWRRKSRKSNAGRKANIPFRAVLVVFLLHAQLGWGLRYQDLADTLHLRFRYEEFELLNIQNIPGDRRDWYKRVWHASNRMLSHLDPYPVPRNKRLSPEEYQKVMKKLNKRKGKENSKLKQRRLDWVCERLVHTSLSMLPRHLWDTYAGNISIDATLVETSGGLNPVSDKYRRGSADPIAGRYRREGKHDGKGKNTDQAGYELETAVMTWNNPVESTIFPSLVTAVNFHRPGEIRGAGLNLVTSHKRHGFDRFLVMADRAYNNSKPEHFQTPARKLGVEFVFDYKTTNLGLQGHYDDLILVDGNWYIKYMPQNLIDATKDHANKTIDDETLHKLIESRDAYRATPKGRPDADGYQRFTFPEPGSYMAIDRATGKRVPHPTQRGSITIPPALNTPGDRKADPAKHIQKFPYKSPTWDAYYGMRNLVENKNKELKVHRLAYLKDKAKRSGRGYTFNYIAATVAVVASNLERIASFVIKTTTKTDSTAKTRTRRRKNPNGTPLERREPPTVVKPPL